MFNAKLFLQGDHLPVDTQSSIEAILDEAIETRLREESTRRLCSSDPRLARDKLRSEVRRTGVISIWQVRRLYDGSRNQTVQI